jgi:hypothetical protein
MTTAQEKKRIKGVLRLPLLDLSSGNDAEVAVAKREQGAAAPPGGAARLITAHRPRPPPHKSCTQKNATRSTNPSTSRRKLSPGEPRRGTTASRPPKHHHCTLATDAEPVIAGTTYYIHFVARLQDSPPLGSTTAPVVARSSEWRTRWTTRCRKKAATGCHSVTPSRGSRRNTLGRHSLPRPPRHAGLRRARSPPRRIAITGRHQRPRAAREGRKRPQTGHGLVMGGEDFLFLILFYSIF